MNEGKTQTTAWLTDAVYEKLRQSAFSRRVTQSAVIEEALVALLGGVGAEAGEGAES